MIYDVKFKKFPPFNHENHFLWFILFHTCKSSTHNNLGSKKFLENKTASWQFCCFKKEKDFPWWWGPSAIPMKDQESCVIECRSSWDWVACVCVWERTNVLKTLLEIVFSFLSWSWAIEKEEKVGRAANRERASNNGELAEGKDAKRGRDLNV